MDYLSKAPSNRQAARALIGGLVGEENACQATQERKPSNTECALKELETQHGRVDALISELERRLSPILLPCQPQQGSESPEGSMCTLAVKLTNEAELVRALAERLDSIISRIDV